MQYHTSFHSLIPNQGKKINKSRTTSDISSTSLSSYTVEESTCYDRIIDRPCSVSTTTPDITTCTDTTTMTDCTVVEKDRLIVIRSDKPTEVTLPKIKRGQQKEVIVKCYGEQRHTIYPSAGDTIDFDYPLVTLSQACVRFMPYENTWVTV